MSTRLTDFGAFV